MPPSVDKWLPEQHLARFVVKVVGGLDINTMTKSYRGINSASYCPAVRLGLLAAAVDVVRAATTSSNLAVVASR